MIKNVLALFLIFLFSSSTVIALEDELVNSLDKNLKIKTYKTGSVDEIIPKTDRVIEEYKPPKISETSTNVKVKIKEPFTTADYYAEGEKITFLTVEEVKIKDKIYPKNTEIEATVELVAQNKALGIPASVVVGNFSLGEHKFFGEISKKGANRALWVSPLVQVGSFFFGLGLAFIPIRGGHAKIRKNETFELQLYETQ